MDFHHNPERFEVAEWPEYRNGDNEVLVIQVNGHPVPDRPGMSNYRICLGGKWKLKILISIIERQEMNKLIIDRMGRMLPVYGRKTYGSRRYRLQQMTGTVNSGSTLHRPGDGTRTNGTVCTPRTGYGAEP